MLNRIAFKLTLALGLLAATPALAWDDLPGSLSTTVTRVLDVGAYTTRTIVALADSPGAHCATLAGATGLNRAIHNDAWISLRSTFNNALDPTAAAMLSVAMYARAQNLQVRVTFQRGGNGECVVIDIRTCADAVACALPAAP